MPIAPGTKLGPYEVTVPLGAGGMGEVYRARDTKLDRDVAIKVLPDELAKDKERVARFEREAKLLASLNHPNIASIYGFESGALVLELVEGPTLAERIAKGPIPVDEAIAIARQIAEALEAGHDAGIIHRDLKPANVKLKEDGTIKVLDYGLAKALEGDTGEGSDSGLSQSPTMTRGTHVGTILGTAAYMSPEQARGRKVDKRTDIWSFGAVLFEMVTGKKLVSGETVSETLASVIKDDPDLGEAPPQLRRVLDACLQKDPKERLRDIGDAWRLLGGPPPVNPELPASAASRPKLPWLLAGLCVMVAVAALVMMVLPLGEPPASAETIRFQLAFPTDNPRNSFALSPDGRHLAYVLEDQAWVRALDSLEAVLLEGTHGASYLFWAPDSETLGFFADDQLKTVARTGGRVRNLAPAAGGRGATWGSNGTIVYAPDGGHSGLLSVAASGDDVRAVTTLSGDVASNVQRFPHFLPDGERFLYLHLAGDADVEGVYVGSLDGTEPVRVLEGRDQAIFTATSARNENGYLVFRRGSALMAQPFDSISLQTRGASFLVAEGVSQGSNTGSGAFSISTNGTLAYGHRFFDKELAWFDRKGERLESVTDSTGVYDFSISRDQQFAAISILGERGWDVWLQDLSEGSPVRFTFGPSPGWTHPVWAADGSSLAYNTSTTAGLANFEIRRKQADMSEAEETLLSSNSIFWLWDWAPDESYLVYSQPSQSQDIQLLPLEGDRTPVPYLETEAWESHAQISPDGRWMAYVSNEQGDPQVFVRSIPATDALWQISTGGGSMPRWRQDGRELFFRAADGTLTAVDVGANGLREGSAASFEYAPTPKPLFGGVFSGGAQVFSYQPSANGQRFAMAVPTADTEQSITVVVNWFEELNRLVPTDN